MGNKRFLSKMSIGLAIIMVISLFYIISSNFKKEVKDYKLGENLYYTGTIKKNKFQGRSSLKSSDGTFSGAFKDSRFDGPGLFKGDDYMYIANFDKKKGNSNITVFLKNGNSYRKIDGKWKEMDDDNEN